MGNEPTGATDPSGLQIKPFYRPLTPPPDDGPEVGKTKTYWRGNSTIGQENRHTADLEVGLNVDTNRGDGYIHVFVAFKATNKTKITTIPSEPADFLARDFFLDNERISLIGDAGKYNFDLVAQYLEQNSPGVFNVDVLNNGTRVGGFSSTDIYQFLKHKNGDQFVGVQREARMKVASIPCGVGTSTRGSQYVRSALRFPAMDRVTPYRVDWEVDIDKSGEVKNLDVSLFTLPLGPGERPDIKDTNPRDPEDVLWLRSSGNFTLNRVE